MENKELFDVKLFGKWDFSEVKVLDKGLERYLNLKPVYVPRSFGKNANHRFHKSKMSIVERLVTHMMVPGHKGKRHRLYSNHSPAKFINKLEIVEKAFEIVEKKTKKNPLQVFVKALENGAMREEVTSFQIGSVMVRSAVITAPQRRVDKVLRNIAQGVYQKTYRKKTKAEDALAGEIIAASENDSEKSVAVQEKERMEREASGAR